MKQEVLEQIASLLAGEVDDSEDDLDSLEDQVLGAVRQIGQQALQGKLWSFFLHFFKHFDNL